MTSGTLDLKNPPIIEAVVDINCDLPPTLEYEQIQERAKDALDTSFPKWRRIMMQSQSFGIGTETAPVASVADVVGLQFLSDDERQLVQFRGEGFSFNRLAPYSSLDDYLPIIERSWETFRTLAQPVQVRGIALRFINRILLPVMLGERLDDYLYLPQLATESSLMWTGFLNQHHAVDPATGNRVNVVLAMQDQNSERGKLPIIFDIETSDPQARPPENWDGIKEAILTLRRLKNDVFQRTLKPACMTLFQ